MPREPLVFELARPEQVLRRPSLCEVPGVSSVLAQARVLETDPVSWLPPPIAMRSHAKTPHPPPLRLLPPIASACPFPTRYPHCLFFLDLVQSQEFREAVAHNKVSVRERERGGLVR